MHGREVVTYLRVSTQLQGLDGFGIAAQRDAVVRFLKPSGARS
jgi:DNA invertase Pin-like site-specific DNA recombinase